MAIPSKKTRKLAEFRLLALRNGFKIETTSLKKKFKNYMPGMEIYSLKNLSSFKQGHFINGEFGWELYDPITLKHSSNFESQIKKINEIDKPILEIIFFESNIAFLWKENEDLEILKNIKSVLN
jgi:hypothetical protein